MADSTIKSIAIFAFGSVMVASWVANNPDRAKSLIGAAESVAAAPAAVAPRPAPKPVAPPPSVQRVGYGVEALRADGGGQYHSDVEFQGIRVPMLVDTGATLVALTYDDARRIGFTPNEADFTFPISTANGKAFAAKITAPEIRLGTLLVSDVPTLILPRDVKGTSLLGMSFLKKLSSFQIADATLTMRQ